MVAEVEAPRGRRTITGAQWGADESIRRRGPMYDKGIKAGAVHHAASVNDNAQRIFGSTLPLTRAVAMMLRYAAGRNIGIDVAEPGSYSWEPRLYVTRNPRWWLLARHWLAS